MMIRKLGLVLLMVVFLAGCDQIKSLTDPDDEKGMPAPTPVGNLVISNIQFEDRGGCKIRFDYSGAVGGIKEVYAYTGSWQLVTNYRVTGTTEGTIFEETGWAPGQGAYGRYITDNSGQISNTLSGKPWGCLG